MSSINRISLGTANFGFSYGLYPSRVQENDMRNILSAARDSGIKSLDTAEAYGCVESRLLSGYSDWFDITCKFRLERNGSYEAIVNRYKAYPCKILLMHNYEVLETDSGRKLADKCLLKLKSDLEGTEVGVSIYDDEHIHHLHIEEYVIQIPNNVFFDRFRKLIDGSVQSKKIQIRSIFMQGLALRSDLARAPAQLQSEVLRLHKFCQERDITALEFCIFSSLERNKNCSLVVGVSSLSQLMEITKAVEKYDILKKNKNIYSYIEFDARNNNWADPRKW